VQDRTTIFLGVEARGSAVSLQAVPAAEPVPVLLGVEAPLDPRAGNAPVLDVLEVIRGGDMRTVAEVEEIIARCDEQELDGGGSKYSGMSYEDGVRNALVWAFGGDALGLDEPEEWPFEE
jgi:hypothetical protein